jgi:hypothetical protein
MGRIKDWLRRKRRPPEPTPVETGWYFNYGDPNPGMETETSFLWTAQPYVEPHYMLHPHGPISADKTITITYRIAAVAGAPVIHSTECGSTQNPAAKAALIIRHSLNNSDYYNRAWWIAVAPMTIGEHTITATVGNGAGWTFVAGGDAGNPTKNAAKWTYMLNNIRDVGLTFNGCSSMGHGAYCIGGTARMTIVSVTVA